MPVCLSINQIGRLSLEMMIAKVHQQCTMLEQILCTVDRRCLLLSAFRVLLQCPWAHALFGIKDVAARCL